MMVAGLVPAWMSSARSDDDGDDPRPDVITGTRP
jgi:hypothetical protein